MNLTSKEILDILTAVKNGESYASVAEKFNVTVEEIMKLEKTYLI